MVMTDYIACLSSDLSEACYMCPLDIQHQVYFTFHLHEGCLLCP